MDAFLQKCFRKAGHIGGNSSLERQTLCFGGMHYMLELYIKKKDFKSQSA